MYTTRQGHFRLKIRKDLAELAAISFFNKNGFGKNENLQTYWQNVITIQKTEPDLYS